MRTIALGRSAVVHFAMYCSCKAIFIEEENIHCFLNFCLHVCRIITEDVTTFGCLLKDLDSPSPLGTIDAVYTSKFSLMDYLEDK